MDQGLRFTADERFWTMWGCSDDTSVLTMYGALFQVPNASHLCEAASGKRSCHKSAEGIVEKTAGQTAR